LGPEPEFGQKKWVRRRWGEELIGGFFLSPHSLAQGGEGGKECNLYYGFCKKSAVKWQWFFFSLEDFKDGENSI